MIPFARFFLSAALLLGVLSLLPAVSSFAQQPAALIEENRDETDESRRQRRASMTPDDMRKRLSAMMKEQFQVESDEEWALIGERMMKVQEIRRFSGGGLAGAAAFMGRGAPGVFGGDNGASNRQRMGSFGGGGSPESEALSAAIKSGAPAAEIKARLERLRETRKQNEIKLAAAQEDLRAVLNMRQEALAVLMGILP